MTKKHIVSLFAAGLAFYGYFQTYKQKPNVDLTNKSNLLIHFQLNCEQTALLSKQISNFTKQNLSSQIQNSDFLLSNISEKTDHIKFFLSLHRDPNHKDFFAELKSDWQKINQKWKPISMDLKFKKGETWSKFYDDVKILDSNSNDSLEQIKSFNLLHDSNKFLDGVAKEPHILKGIACLLKDNEKIKTLGPPICIPFLYFNSYDIDSNYCAKLRVEGQLKSADFLINVDKTELESLCLVYDLDEWGFSNRQIKVNNDPFEIIKKRPDADEWLKILKQIGINKIIENKILSNGHRIDTLGEPLQLLYEIDYVDSSQNNKATIRVLSFGRLNKAELKVRIHKNPHDNNWKVLDTKFNFLWNYERY